MSENTQRTSEERAYEVTVYVMQKFVIEVTASSKEDAESRAIAMSDEEPCVDSYVEDVKTRLLP